MDKILEKLNKLSLPAVILIASIILGGFIYASQVNKQQSIEKATTDRVRPSKQAKAQNTIDLNRCLDSAEYNYRALIDVNSNADGTYKSLTAQKYVEDKYINEKDDCYKQYK